MSVVNLSRKIGEPLKITAPGGYEATIIVKKFDRNVLEIFISAPEEVRVSRPDDERDVYDDLDDEDKKWLNGFMRQ